MAIHGRKIIDLEDGWEFVRKGILKLKSILDGHPEPQFSSEDYIMLYTTIYNMCTQKHPHDYSQQLYDRYKESLMECISSTVLPSLRENHSEFMLRELVRGGPITKLWSDGFHVFSIILIASSLLDGLYHSFMMLVSFAFVIWKMLARRLLFGKSANDDHERSILTKLKQQCGGHLTSTMEGMVIDLTLARGNHTTFEEHLRENLQADLGIDLIVTVLTAGFWPKL